MVGALEFRISVAAGDAVYAVDAAACLMRDRPELRITLSDEGVLVACSRDQGDIRRRWRIALLNERLVAEADERRVELLRALVG